MAKVTHRIEKDLAHGHYVACYLNSQNPTVFRQQQSATSVTPRLRSRYEYPSCSLRLPERVECLQDWRRIRQLQKQPSEAHAHKKRVED